MKTYILEVKKGTVCTTTMLKEPQTEPAPIDGTITFEHDDLQVSDGYHTMDELYGHRIALWISLCRTKESNYGPRVWRSKLHQDGSSFDGWFILGMFKEAGEQISYHLPLPYWHQTDFAETLERAPEWDGHTSADVVERLKTL